MRRLLHFQFVRFLLVGGLNTAFSYANYAALLYMGVPYAAANLGALLLGMAFSFRTQGRLVFRNSDRRLIFRFAACWGLIWVLNIALIALLIRVGLNAYWAGAVAMLPIAVASYFVQRVVVFGASQPASSESTRK